MGLPVYDATTGNWTDQTSVNIDTPSTSDNGYNYGKDIIDLFKFGVGAYLSNDLAKYEDKSQYNAAAGNLYKNGQYAGQPITTIGANNWPLLIGVGVALVALIILIKD